VLSPIFFVTLCLLQKTKLTTIMNPDVTETSPITYTQDEVFKASLQYFKNDDLAARVWLNKYALKDSQGNIYELTPNDMHRRIAKELARIEKKYANPLTEEGIF